MRAKSYELSLLLKALASENRLMILSYLKKNKGSTVGELAEILDLSEPATSQHLRVLRNARIVEYTRRGGYSSYRISLKQDEVVKTILRKL